MFGFLNINKPSGITSHKVIAILRKILGIKQIGHAGTLDPLAKGVLPIAIGKATKLIDYLPTDKRYIAELEFGKISDTYDIEGKIEVTDYGKIEPEYIEKYLNYFRGEINQIPPVYSAVHYNGKRLYELARSGHIPDNIPSRVITIYKNEIIDFDYENQKLKLDITCSKGTYIRSIVNDLGQMLGSGAIMLALTRIEAGGMTINSSIDLKDDLTKEELQKNITSPEFLLPLGVVEINDSEYKLLENGNKFNNYTKDGDVLLKYSNRIVALANAQNGIIQPKKVFI